MRLFVAVVPPPGVAEQLRAVVAAARAGAPELRWVPPPNWHLTLAFLGELQPVRQAELEVRLARAARRHQPLLLQLARAGQFDGRVLFTRVAGDRAGLIRLAGSVQAASRRAGADVDERTYRPHLTLARSKCRVDLDPVMAALAGWSSRTWWADEVVLLASQPPAGSGQPPSYVEMGRWALGRPLH